MNSDLRHAFAHPSERAAATAEAGPLDRISVRDHVVEVEIGAFQTERGTTQRVRFDIVVETRPLTGPVDDDVDRILSYDKITEAIDGALGEERLNLLETLAERIAERVLAEPQAIRTFVRVEKLDRGPGALGVEIVRARARLEQVDAPEDVPHPRLVYLSNAAIDSPRLAGWIDRLQSRARPLIVCVGAPDTDTLATGHPLTQRRVDLLAIEQNAWRLAARDARCVVVATRTEMDWAMKHGQISVWAPSKIVLDAVDETPPATDPVALAAWFAGLFQADEMLVIGADLPSGADVELRAVALDDPIR